MIPRGNFGPEKTCSLIFVLFMFETLDMSIKSHLCDISIKLTYAALG